MEAGVPSGGNRRFGSWEDDTLTRMSTDWGRAKENRDLVLSIRKRQRMYEGDTLTPRRKVQLSPIPS